MIVVALDYETYLASADSAPKPVCLSWCGDPQKGEGVISNRTLQGKDGAREMTRYFLEQAVERESYHLVLQNAKFDLAVIHEHYPELRPLLYEALAQGKIHDTLIREKLYMLSTKGQLRGGKRYGLADLTKRYLNKDVYGFKSGPDVWRLWYCLLDGIPVEHWMDSEFSSPTGAVLDGRGAYEYALQDTQDTLAVFWAQERIRAEEGKGSMNTETLQVKADFCLSLWSMSGLRVDKQAVVDLLEKVDGKIRPLQDKLVELGFATRNYKDCDRVKKMIENLHTKYSKGKVTEEDYEQKLEKYKERLKKYEEVNENGGIFRKDNKRFSEYLETNYGEFVRYGKKTETGKKNVKIDADSLSHFPADEVIQTRRDLSLWEKYRQTYLPALLDRNRAHYPYDVLKETGRTSSFIQVMPRDGGIRECYIPDDNEVLIACDYAALELCSVAQCMYDIFGKSKMRSLLNDGDEPTDIHSIMGAYLYAADHGCAPDVQSFKDLKKNDPAVFKKYRTRGKPVGLGFFGGLGAETMTKVARAQGVEMDEDYAKEARQIHARLFPEVVDYLGYNYKRDDEMLAIKGGGWLESAAVEFTYNSRGEYAPFKYAYSVNGRYRANCTYCSCANGRSMQSPSADGAKEAIFLITRACYDTTRANILYGSKPKAFIHDEIILSCGGSREEQEDKARELSRLMQVGMQEIMPDVRITTEAQLMTRWTKDDEEYILTGIETWTDARQEVVSDN